MKPVYSPPRLEISFQTVYDDAEIFVFGDLRPIRTIFERTKITTATGSVVVRTEHLEPAHWFYSHVIQNMLYERLREGE